MYGEQTSRYRKLMVKGQKLWTAVVARNDNVLHGFAKINIVE